MTTQADTAKQAMKTWLAHPNELGKRPAKIECTRQFSYDDMAYYIFRFKKGLFDKAWLFAVCGGYEGGDTEHCGHVFSEYKEHDPAAEMDDAIKIIEIIKDYWKSRLKALTDKD
jgi:hypothetical protein